MEEMFSNNGTSVADIHPCYEFDNTTYVFAHNPSIICVLAYMFLGFLSVVTVCGNLLVIISVIYFKQLHVPTNFLILSLAVADLFVGVLVFPFSMAFTVTSCLQHEDFLCKIRDGFDVSMCSSSILNLCCISIDRYYAVCHPLVYRTKINVNTTLVMILVTWGISLLIGITIITAGYSQGTCEEMCSVDVVLANTLGPVFAFFLPAIIMICLYLKIFLVAQKQVNSIQSTKCGATISKMERKATKTLAIVMGVFLLCMTPYFLCVVFQPLASEAPPVPLIETLNWLTLSNSMLNPFIYAFFYSWFRLMLQKLKSMEQKLTANESSAVAVIHPCYELDNITFIFTHNPSVICVLVYLCLGFLSVVTVCGNLLVIISVIYFKQLHVPTNFLILSLAVADLFVGVLVFPFSMAFTVTSCLHHEDFLCKLRDSFDASLCTSSILHLCCISIDRYYAVCQPLTYRAKINVNTATVMILVTWVISLLIGITIIIAGFSQGTCEEMCSVDVVLANTLGPVLSFFLPAIIMLIIYLKIFLVAQKQMNSIQSTKCGATISKMERKATKTLAIVMGVFLLCMTPYFLCVVFQPLASEAPPVPLIETLNWLTLSNSMLNPFIYAFFYSWFRKKEIYNNNSLIENSLFNKPFYQMSADAIHLKPLASEAPPVPLIETLNWLTLSNSMLNPFIYGFFYSWFRSDAALMVSDGNLLCNESAAVLSLTAGSVLFCVFISSLSVLIMCGNVLVIVSIVYFKQLHTPTNYLILSLAVGDLLVGAIVVPFSTVLSLSSCWYLQDVLCKVRGCFDIFLCTTSILNLCSISVDRYYAVCQPLRYRTKITVHFVVILIILNWIISALMGVTMSLKSKRQCVLFQSLNSRTVVIGMFLVFYLPTVTMLVIYVKILMVAQRQAFSINNTTCQKTKSRAAVSKMETKATKTLAIVMGVFLICWTPSFLSSAFQPVSKDNANMSVIPALKWLAWSNSMFNPLIYAFFYSWFRSAVKLIISGKIYQGSFANAKLH
ncbi:uncharacterized protein V6R79_009967 [Siganus canaliculatus]